MPFRNKENLLYILNIWLEDSAALVNGIEFEDLVVNLDMNLHFDNELQLIQSKLNEHKMNLV
jgi:hypothetical protein